MEENNHSVNSTSLYFGLLTGIGLIIFEVIKYLLNLETSSYVGFFTYLIIITAVWFAMATHRDKYLNGSISYGKALSVGVLTMVYASLLLAFYFYIFYKFIDPEALERMAIQAEELLYQSGYNEDTIDAMVKTQKAFIMKPGFMAFSQFFSTALYGTFISLIVALFAKRNYNKESL